MAALSHLIMKEKPVMTGAMAVYPYSAQIESRYTVMSRFGDPVKLWETASEGYIKLPRAICPISEQDNRVLGAPVLFNCTTKARNSEQARVIEEANALLKKGESFIVRAPTGFGKTVISMPIIASVGRTTLIVVTKEDLIDEWRATIVKHLGIPAKDIGFIRQDAFDVTGKQIVIAMLHSLVIPDRYPLWIRKQFGFVIFDEVHLLGAETFSRVCTMFSAKLRMGLSATPERADGKEVVFFSHIGPVKVETEMLMMKPKVLLYRSSWMCPRVMSHDKKTGAKKVIKMPHSPGKVGHVLKLLYKDPNRNNLIGELGFTAWSKKRATVIFSDQLNHLELIHSILMTKGVPGKDLAFYIGGMKKDAREKAKVAPIMLATYQMMSYGTNIPWLDCAVFSGPRSDVEQIAGRVLREYPDKPQPIIFDVVDEDSPVFKGYYRSRLRYYSQIGATIKLM